MSLVPRAGGIATAGYMQALTNWKTGSAASTTTTVSSSFAVLSSLTYVKVSETSSIYVEMYACCSTVTSTATLEFGLRFTSSTYDYAIIQAPLTTLAVRRFFFGALTIAGMPVGSQTVSLIWRRASGTGTGTMTTNDGVSWSMCEVQE